MDKKSIIGFILILAILFLMPYFQKMLYPPSPEPPPDKQTAEQPIDQVEYSETTDKTPTPTQPPAGAESGEIDYQTAIEAQSLKPERLITVETADVIAVLSSHGGLIKSIQLKKYFVENGQNGNSLVELITPSDLNPWPAMGAITLGDEEKIAPVNSLPFEVEGYDIVLVKGDDPQILSFTYADPTGASVRKDYTFKPEGYNIKLRLSVINPKALGLDKRITLGWMVPNLPSEKDYGEDLGKFGEFYYSGDFVDIDEVNEKDPYFTQSGETKWVAKD